MEIDNTSRTQRHNSRQINFFNNLDSSTIQKNLSSDFQDEQELPQYNDDEDMIDEYDGQSFKQNQFTVEKSNLQNQQQLSGYKVNEGNGMRLPLNSSEMFNAFSNESLRDNRTMGYVVTSSSKANDFTPINFNCDTGMKENHQRVLSLSYMGNFKVSNHKIDINKNSMKSQQQLSQGESEINTSKKLQIQNFFVPQQTNVLDDINELNCDQEYYMTEQDYDGHDDLNQDEDQYDHHDQDHDHEVRDRNINQKAYNEDNSQEGNIPISSKSASPDEKKYQKNSIPNQTDYLSNHLDQNEEDFRESRLARSSNQTEKSDLPFNNNNNNMIIERNDRFIIFKMVPQVNQSIKQSQIKNQPTPALGEQQFEYNKAYSETVEDMHSDSDDQQDESTKQKYADLGFNPPGTNLPPINNNMDESLFEESRVVQHEIRSVKNQLVNSQQQQQNLKSIKPPMIKQISPSNTVTQRDTKKGGNAYNLLSRAQNESNFDATLEEYKLRYGQESKDQSLSQSLTANSHSSSDKFSRLQKLEKKNLQEENPDAVDIMMTKNNINLLIKQQQQVDILRKRQEIVEQVKLSERRQSDSAVIVRNSLLLQQQQQQQQMQDNRTQMNLSTNNTNINTAQSMIQNESSQHIEENDQLIMEYKKLKQIMKQMKHEPQQTLREKTVQKQFLQQQNQIPKNKLVTQKSQNKSKKNLRQEEQHQIRSNLMSSYHSEEENNNTYLKGNGNKSNIQTAQQTSKAKEGKNKEFFKGHQNSKDNSQITKKREQSYNKFLQRQSPSREKKSKFQNNQKRRERNSDEEYEEECNQSTPENSYYIQKKKNKSLAIKQMRHKKDLLSYDSQNHNQTPEDQSIYNSQSNENSRQYNDNQKNKTYQQFSQNDSYYNQSYDEEEDQEEEENYSDDSDSNKYSESCSDGSHRSSSESSKQRQRKQKKSKELKYKKNNRVTKTYTQGDRKLKIIMHGGQYTRSNKAQQQEFIEKQRQLLQQQYMIQLAQFPQQQMLLQQQLALQQQLLMQPQIQQQQTFFNAAQNLSHATQQQQTQLDLSNIQPTQQQQQQQKQQQFSQQNNLTNYNNGNNYQAQNNDLQGLRRQISNKNLNQPGFKTQREIMSGNFSPKRDFNIQTNNNNNNIPQSTNISSIRSPRDEPRQNQIVGSWLDPQSNYLNQLKNRFKTGSGALEAGQDLGYSGQNSIPGQGQNMREIDEEYFNPTSSRNRNNYIAQNKSSPLTRHNRDRSENYNNQGSGYDRRFQDNYNKFSEERQYPQKAQYNDQNESKHNRNNSYINQYQRNQQPLENQKNEEDQYEKIRMKYKPEIRNEQFNNFDEDFNHPVPLLQQKKTGEFGLPQDRFSQRQKINELFDQQKDRDGTSSPSPTGMGDQSMDEGVKASHTRQTMQKSPKTIDFQQLSVKKLQRPNNDDVKQPKKSNPFSRDSDKLGNTKTIQINLQSKKEQQPQPQKTEQDKKGPQALWIGFDDENNTAQQQKDPFQNKPQLKNREKAKEQTLRSKSTKGTTPSIKSNAVINLKQRKSPMNKEDQQLKSPTSKESLAFSITPNANPSQQSQLVRKPYKPPNNNNSNQQNKLESPLKRVVNDIKNEKNLSLVETKTQELGDDFVPNHNKGIMIEIFDKQVGNNKGPKQQKEVSLAEMFKAKQKDAALNKKQDQDQNVLSHMNQEQQQDKPAMKKTEKTKEELAELRKAMMKSKVKRKEDNFGGGAPIELPSGNNNQEVKQQAKKDPKQDLMVRLAMGQKVQVDKKEMKKLTNKNYSNLPEIKKKKEEEKKKQENAARKAAAAEYMKQFNEKRKQMLKKKKSLVNEDD